MASTNSAISFKKNLLQIDAALARGDIVTSNLKIVEKHGFKWLWIRFTIAITNLFNCFSSCDPWKAYRINEVAASLAKWASENKNYLTPEAKNQFKEIFHKLEVKAGHAKHKDVYLQVLSNSLKIIQRQCPEHHKEYVCNAIAKFAQDLCHELSEKFPQNKSFSISPISLIAALGMSLHMTKPEHKAQFLEKIGLKSLKEAEAHQAIAAVLKGLVLPDNFKKGCIEVAQGLACKENSGLADSLVQLIKQTYDGDIMVSNDLMDKVNTWAAERTHNKIPSILSDNNAVFVLLNAIYLNFEWKQKFAKPSKGWETKQFTCLDGTTAPVSMMTQTGKFHIYNGFGFDMLEKPYVSPQGRKLSQLIFLPHDPNSFEKLENHLMPANIQDCRDNTKLCHNVELSMPKTKSENEFHLLDILKAMGFPLESLDEKIVGQGRYISDIIHKTYIATHEEGSEAAAISAVIVVECTTQPKIFNIDHSYIYLIMDGDTVLFRGRVSDPSALVVDKK